MPTRGIRSYDSNLIGHVFARLAPTACVYRACIMIGSFDFLRMFQLAEVLVLANEQTTAMVNSLNAFFPRLVECLFLLCFIISAIVIDQSQFFAFNGLGLNVTRKIHHGCIIKRTWAHLNRMLGPWDRFLLISFAFQLLFLQRRMTDKKQATN